MKVVTDKEAEMYFNMEKTTSYGITFKTFQKKTRKISTIVDFPMDNLNIDDFVLDMVRTV